MITKVMKNHENFLNFNISLILYTIKNLLSHVVVQENSTVVSIDGYEHVPANDENALLKAAANQPVSVSIESGSSDFRFYSEVNYLTYLT